MKKKLCNIGLACLLVAILSTPVFATHSPVTFDTLVEPTTLSQADISLLTQQFSEMSDDEFDRTIAELATSSTDFEVLRSNLDNCGVELKVVEQSAHSSGFTRSLDDSDARITVAVAQRAGETYYHIVIGLVFSDYEPYPSSQDGVSIFFDASKAEYVDYNEGFGFRLRSGQRATEGTLVFNFDDSLLTLWDGGYKKIFYGAIYADPYGSDRVVFGADYAHTYGDIDFNVTSGSIGFNFGPIMSGAVSVNFEVSSEESMWQIGVVDSF